MAPTSPKRSKQRLAADELRQRINVGAYVPGQPLPSEAELAVELGIPRATVHEALGILKAEGLIISGRGRGTQVRPKVPPLSLSLDDYRRALAIADGEPLPPLPMPPGADPTATYQPGREVAADEDLAYQFGVAKGTPLWRREAMVSLFKQPRWVIVSYLLGEVAAGTPLADAGHRWPAERTGIVGELASIGLRPESVVEEELFGLPSADEVDRLRILGQDCMVRILRKTYAGGRVVEVARSIDYQGSQVRVRNTINLGDS